MAPVLTAMGQKPFSAPSPKGWAEEAADWAAPDAVIKRMSWSEAFAQATAPVTGQPMELAQNALGARLTPPRPPPSPTPKAGRKPSPSC